MSSDRSVNMSQIDLNQSDCPEQFIKTEGQLDFKFALLVRKLIFVLLVVLNIFLIYSAYSKKMISSYAKSPVIANAMIIGDIAITEDTDNYGENENVVIAALHKASDKLLTSLQSTWMKFNLFLSGDLNSYLANNNEAGNKNGIDQVLTLAEFYQEIIRDSKTPTKRKLKINSNSHKTLESAAEMIESTPLGSPVVGQITSNFGKRSSPFSGRVSFHSGVDISIPQGTPVVASADGIVKFSGRKGGYGKIVQIQHPNGKETRYAHLSKVDVLPGRKVKRGQRIGAVGSTGQSTGPHLHYEIRKDGVAIDPKPFMDLGVKLARR